MDFHSTQSSGRNVLLESDYAQGPTLMLKQRGVLYQDYADFYSKNYAITGTSANSHALFALCAKVPLFKNFIQLAHACALMGHLYA